jgi:hypothetical protein
MFTCIASQELVNRWSEQIFGAHRDERESADLRERHAQMQEARAARKRAEQMAAAAAEGAAQPVSCCEVSEAECLL